MQLTKFRFFKNTPFTDFENTIHFESNQERDDFFLNGNHYDYVDYDAKGKFNFIRSRNVLRINKKYSEMYGVNYCTFQTDNDKRYYARVLSYSYINDGRNGVNTVQVILSIDGVMTELQGDFIANNSINNVMIEREHLTNSQYKIFLSQISTNSDILKTTTLKYIKTESKLFDDLSVVLLSSVSLSTDFGTQDGANVFYSVGNRVDNVVSPLSVYTLDYGDWKKFTQYMAAYPWVYQNISKAVMIPSIMINKGATNKIKVNTKEDLNVYEFKQDYVSTALDLTEFKKSIADLMNIFNIKDWKNHLMRTPYCSIELTNYSGEKVVIEPEFLSTQTGLDLLAFLCIGYYNQFSIFPKNYKSNNESSPNGNYNGTFLDNALNFVNFDDIPMIIDNYKLSLANSGHQRTLENSKQFTNRVQNIMSGSSNNGQTGRIMDAINIGTDLTGSLSTSGIGTMTGMATSILSGTETSYEYYRKQKAEFEDKAITPPTVTTQSATNNFAIANQIFGIFLRFSKIADSEFTNIETYHDLLGFEVNRYGRPDEIDSMSIVNFLKFSGNWNVKDCDPSVFALIKTQLENGLKFWKNNNTSNPFTQDVSDNKRVK